MHALGRFRIDSDRGALWFASEDQGALTEALCAALGAIVEGERSLVYVRRQELVSEEGRFPLFHDEDGSSHLELAGLNDAARARIIGRLRAVAGE